MPFKKENTKPRHDKPVTDIDELDKEDEEDEDENEEEAEKEDEEEADDEEGDASEDENEDVSLAKQVTHGKTPLAKGKPIHKQPPEDDEEADEEEEGDADEEDEEEPLPPTKPSKAPIAPKENPKPQTLAERILNFASFLPTPPLADECSILPLADGTYLIVEQDLQLRPISARRWSAAAAKRLAALYAKQQAEK